MSIDAASPRFLRQRTLAGFGAAGQRSLAAAHVVVLGAGGVGSGLLPTLAAAGVGSITIVDDDTVDETNLHRQTLYTPGDVGAPKAASAAAALLRQSPETRVRAVEDRFDADNAADLLAGADLLIDATDDGATRYAADDAAAAAAVPLVWGNALGWSGQVGVAGDSARFRDLFPVEPDDVGATCADVGVLPSVCAVVGGLMAGEALKVLTGSGDPLLGRVLLYDARQGRVREVEYRRADVAPTARAPRAPRPAAVDGATLEALLTAEPGLALVDVREPWEAAIAGIPGSVLVPLAELPDRMVELDPTAPTVVYCHHGVRSVQAAQRLVEAGFADVRHLDGGIDAWSRTVDPGTPRY